MNLPLYLTRTGPGQLGAHGPGWVFSAEAQAASRNYDWHGYLWTRAGRVPIGAVRRSELKAALVAALRGERAVTEFPSPSARVAVPPDGQGRPIPDARPHPDRRREGKFSQGDLFLLE